MIIVSMEFKVVTEYDTLGSVAGWKCSFRPLSHLTRLGNQYAIVISSHTIPKFSGDLGKRLAMRE